MILRISSKKTLSKFVFISPLFQKKCTTSVEDVDEPGCQAEAEAVCTRKFSTASDACFINENMYKEKEA